MIKTEYKHIYFEKVEQKAKTAVWHCINRSGDLLGEVKWHCPWRQYCFFTEDDIIYARSCLDDVSDFIRQLMEARKGG